MSQHLPTNSPPSASSATLEGEPVTTQEGSRSDVEDTDDNELSPDRDLRSKETHSRRRREPEDPASLELIKQPETQPISQEQLVAEVKGIYAGLVMVESKCIEVGQAHNTQDAAKLGNEQWQALIALHHTLLQEHHDFLLASQHPSAGPALRRLASKYAMPARMWRHGIHSFLELLQRRLPASQEHMLTFVHMAYSMLALLYETVPAFQGTWAECLGDAARYRMVIEPDDIRGREIWMSVSRDWYSKVSDIAPTTGRLYHHLAILARPSALWQLFYYTKSLCVSNPFPSARDSIRTLFDPVLNIASVTPFQWASVDTALVKAHGILFNSKMTEEYASTVAEFLDDLDNHIERSTRWMESGYLVAIVNCCSLLSYGKNDNVLCRFLRPQRADEAAEAVNTTESSDRETGTQWEQALPLVNGTHEKVFCRLADPNILPYVHVVLAFLLHSCALGLIGGTFPWTLLSKLLNSLLLSYRDYDMIHSNEFPRRAEGTPRPLPEDFAMRGLPWTETYFPSDWFSPQVEYNEQYFERASMTEERKERVLWLGVSLAKPGKWLMYDETKHRFAVARRMEKKATDEGRVEGTCCRGRQQEVR